MIQKKILVIDDDDGVRAIVQISLETLTNWQVLTAASGKEGLSEAIDSQPDAILLDVMMPELDGPKTFQLLRANAKTEKIPTILLTAKAKISEQQRFIDLGVTGLIIKPFQPINLVQQLQDLLHWYSNEQ